MYIRNNVAHVNVNRILTVKEYLVRRVKYIIFFR